MIEPNFLAPPRAPGEIGRLGLYRVRRTLRSGEAGIVFEAEDPQAHTCVALQALPPERAADAGARQRFVRGAEAMAELRHRHIVAIREVGEAQGVPYLVMPLVPGETLQDRLARDGRVPLLDVLRFGWEIAEGLAAAHGRRVAHGNLTAADVWLETTERSTAAAPHDRAGGKPLSLAQASDGPATTNDHVRLLNLAITGDAKDWRDGLFGLGWLLYRMSTGVAPFAQVTVPEVVRHGAAAAAESAGRARAWHPAGIIGFDPRTRCHWSGRPGAIGGQRGPALARAARHFDVAWRGARPTARR